MTIAEYRATIEGQPKKAAPRKHEESDIQQAFVAWFRTAFPKKRRSLFAIINGAVLSGDKAQRARQWARLEREGANPGTADLFLSIPSGDYAGLYIETKTAKRTQTDDQKEFEAAVTADGYGYVICRSAADGAEIVKRYLETGKILKQ